MLKLLQSVRCLLSYCVACLCDQDCCIGFYLQTNCKNKNSCGKNSAL